MLFVEYPKCSTCKKAKQFLDGNNITYQDRHIIENNPTFEELCTWYEKSGLDINRLFNTSGLVYREEGLKNRLPKMSEKEKLMLLSTDGRLVKRPVLVGEDFALFGFKEAEWKEKTNK